MNSLICGDIQQVNSKPLTYGTSMYTEYVCYLDVLELLGKLECSVMLIIMELCGDLRLIIIMACLDKTWGTLPFRFY